MQIRYRNTLDDLVALQKFVLRNTDTGKKMMLHRYIVVEIILVLILSLFAVNHNRWNVLLAFLIVSTLAWLFRERSVLVQFKRDFKRERRKDKQGLFDRDRILRIDADGFDISIGTDTTHHDWDQVELTGKDRKHIYIVLKGLLHHVIPLSALNDPADADRLLQAIASYRQSD